MGQFILCQVLFLPCSPSCGLCIPLLRLAAPLAKRLLRKGKFSIWSQCRLGSMEVTWLLGKRSPGKGGLQRIHLGRPSQAPVQVSHSHCVPVPMGVQTLLCSVSLFKTPRLTSWPAYGKEWAFVEPEILQSWFHVILTASLQVGTWRSPWTSYKTLNKLVNHPCLPFLTCEH